MNRTPFFVLWGILVFALVMALVTGFARPMSEALAYREALADKQRLLARLEQLPAQERVLRQRLLELGETPPDQFLFDDNAAASVTALQRSLTTLAGQSAIRLAAVRRGGTVRGQGDLQGFSVTLSFTATLDELVDFLKRIQAAAPLIAVTELSINRQGSPGPYEAASLQVTLDVAGYQRRGPGG